MQLTRWNPLAELDQIQRRINRVFLDPAAAMPREEAFADFAPAIDVQETETDFIVKADLPDVKKDDIKIQMQEGVLSIEGERRKEKEETGKRFHKVEREYGRFIRSFALPTPVDPAAVRAEFKDGVLTVFLPKVPESKPKQIDVKIA